MRLAAFQMEAQAGDVAANLALIASAAANAKGRGADVLVAPELAVAGYGAGDALRDLAEPADGPQVAALAEIATAAGLAIIAGFAERAEGGIFNTAAFVDPSGRRIVYRKRNLYGPYEKALFVPGDAAPPIIEIGGMKAGLLICYDVEFPECARALALAGAELILVPTALPESEHAALIAEKMIPVRAFENQVAIVYANHAGRDRRFAYAGRSCIAMPDGSDTVRASAAGSALLVADYMPAAYARSRAENPYLADLRRAF